MTCSVLAKGKPLIVAEVMGLQNALSWLTYMMLHEHVGGDCALTVAVSYNMPFELELSSRQYQPSSRLLAWIAYASTKLASFPVCPAICN